MDPYRKKILLQKIDTLIKATAEVVIYAVIFAAALKYLIVGK